MRAYVAIHRAHVVVTALSLSLLVTGCSMFSGEAKVHKTAKGSVYLKEIADWSFEASHPATIDRTTMVKVLKGMLTEDGLKMSSNMPASGSKPMRMFSDEDAEFLAPLLAQGLSQAKPEQIVGFKVSPSAGSGAEPTAGTLYAHKGALYLTIAPSQSNRVSGFVLASAARLEKAPSFVAMGSGAMTMVIDYATVAKAPMPGSVLVAGAPKPMSASAPAATPSVSASGSASGTQVANGTASQEGSAFLDPQAFPAQSQTESETSQLNALQLSTDELLNRKFDELREAREANKLKDSEIAMLKKETAWMKKELRQRAEEVKALKATKASARPAPKKKTAEARPSR